MTTIPDHTQGADDGRDEAERNAATERIEEVGTRAEEATRRIAAAIAGALDGFASALERYDVANETNRAIKNTGEVTRAVAGEASMQAHTPEMQQLGHGIRNMTSKTGEMAGSATSATGEKLHHAGERVHHAADSAKESVHHAVDSARHAVYRAKESVHHAKEEVKVRAEAVAETGRRARIAPRNIGHELGEAFATWKKALVTSIVLGLVMAVVGTIALVVLTIALVVGLNAVFGDPAGTFVVAILYLIAAGVAFAVMRSAKTRAAHEREERMENVREEMRHVARPVREAFSRGRAGY